MKKTSSQMQIHEFTASVVREGKWYLGTIDEVPGVHSQGKTLKELEENLKDALSLVFEVRRDIASKTRRGKGRSLSIVTPVA